MVDDLPVFVEGDEPRPWWIVRGLDAWARAYWAPRWPLAVKRNKRRYGRGALPRRRSFRE